MAHPGQLALTGWRRAFVFETRRQPNGALWLAHVGTAGASDDVQLLNGPADAPALDPLLRDPNRLVHHVAVNGPTHAAGALYLERQILAVRAAPPVGSTGTLVLPVGGTRGRRPAEPPLVLFELDRTAEKFKLVNQAPDMPDEHALTAIAGQVATQAGYVREPTDDWTVLDPNYLPTLWLGSGEYLDGAATALAKRLAVDMPGGRQPDYVVTASRGRYGLAVASDQLPAIPPSALAFVAAAAHDDPQALGLYRQEALHGERLTRLIRSYSQSRSPSQRALAELLTGAFGYAATSDSGYTVVAVNKRPEGLAPYLNVLLPHFTQGFDTGLRRDPETGLRLCGKAGRIGKIEEKIAEHVNRSGGGVVAFDLAQTPGGGPGFLARCAEAEESVTADGGCLLRVPGEQRLLAIAPAERARELAASLEEPGAWRVTVARTLTHTLTSALDRTRLGGPVLSQSPTPDQPDNSVRTANTQPMAIPGRGQRNVEGSDEPTQPGPVGRRRRRRKGFPR